jgi:FkbM family methyltransferase
MRVDDFDQDLIMDVDPRDIIGINVWHRPELFEKKERELFCSAISSGSVVLDIGANIGIYTLLAAKRGARVFAVEADPNNAKILRHHIKTNGFTQQVTVIEMAAAERSQTIPLYRDPTNSGHSNLYSGRDPVSVHGDSIDSLGLPPVDVCKIDIEGSEVAALRGMLLTIRNSPRMRMLIEHSAQFGHTAEMLAFLRLHFSRITVVGKGLLRPKSAPPSFCNLWLSGSR